MSLRAANFGGSHRSVHTEMASNRWRTILAASLASLQFRGVRVSNRGVTNVDTGREDIMYKSSGSGNRIIVII